MKTMENEINELAKSMAKNENLISWMNSKDAKRNATVGEEFEAGKMYWTTEYRDYGRKDDVILKIVKMDDKYAYIERYWVRLDYFGGIMDMAKEATDTFKINKNKLEKKWTTNIMREGWIRPSRYGYLMSKKEFVMA